jgi:hypothetical protein
MVEIRRRTPPVMEAMAVPLDPLAIHRWRVVVRLNQFDVHVARKTHRNRHIRGRIAATVFGVAASEVIEQKPRAYFQLIDPHAHGRAYIRYDVAHLNDAIIRLTKSHKTHWTLPKFDNRRAKSAREIRRAQSATPSVQPPSIEIC